MLERLYVDNYRCLVNFEFKPTRKQLIVGLNGSGKSSALDVLTMLRDFSIRGAPCADRLGTQSTTRWQLVDEQRFEVDWRSNLGLYRYSLTVQAEERPGSPGQSPVRVLREEVALDGKPLFLFEGGTIHLHNDRHEDKVNFGFDWRRSGLAIVEPRQDNTKLIAWKRWLDRVRHVQINPWLMTSRSESEALEPRRDMSNFADWYRHLLLEKGEEVQNALADLRQILPGFATLRSREAGQNVRVLMSQMEESPTYSPSTPSPSDSNENEAPFEELSEGQRCLVALYVLLHCAVERDSTLLIDEPDNFVSLSEIQPWLLRLVDAVEERQAQALVVSHHPEVLNQMAASGAVVFDRPGGGPTLVRPFPTSGADPLTPAEIVARGWERA